MIIVIVCVERDREREREREGNNFHTSVHSCNERIVTVIVVNECTNVVH